MNKLSRIFRPFHIPPKKKIKIFKEKDTLSKGYKLLSNYGIIGQSSTGMYHVLPMGQRSIDKLIKLISSQMKLIGAQKMSQPLLTKQSLWEESETFEKSKDELYIITDRAENRFILSPTHEQALTNLLSRELMSYRDFPQLLYQITPKFRNEHRPKLGLLRSKEFLMKDLYSFDINEEEAAKSYNKVSQAYENFFQLIGIDYCRIECLQEQNVNRSHEYYYISDVGDDKLYSCDHCNSKFHEDYVRSKNKCPSCLSFLNEDHFVNAIEIGHTFSFGTYFSDHLGSCYVNIDCKRSPLHMCSFGIGISRLISASVEILSTDEELRWPLAIAPYSVCIIPPKAGSREEIEVELLLPKIYELLEGIPNLNDDILIDDRTEKTIGKRFLEAKLFGFPFIIIVGKDATQETPLYELHDLNNEKKYLMPMSLLTQYLVEQMHFDDSNINIVLS
ncbi:hypothetical protein PGB90_004356 [Kerria lacca]